MEGVKVMNYEQPKKNDPKRKYTKAMFDIKHENNLHKS